MDRMSRPVHDLREHYEVVVVGSGYGGGIAAARLAADGRQVCVLERGKELHPGEYPNTFLSARRQIQASFKRLRIGSRTAMIDVRLGPDISVVAGCGLGGTSLINANVALRASEGAFGERWPRELRGRRALAELEPYYRAAEKMLGTATYPEDWPALPKYVALQRSAEAFGKAKVEPAPLFVTYKTGPNAVGVMQRACTLCGDCVSGCNQGAKNTVLMNYIPYAYQHGAEIFTEVEVRHVRKLKDGKWLVEFLDLTASRLRFGPKTRVISADVVVLGAGSLGSTEILLRSREAGLPLSRRLGLSFTGNGDVLGLAFDTDARTHGIGLGRRPPTQDTVVGACINGSVRITDGKPSNDILVQEGAVPGAVKAIVGPALGFAALIWGKDGKRGLRRLLRRLRQLFGSFFGSRRGTASRSFPWLVMSIDDDMGKMSLVNDRLRISWPGVENGEFVARDNAVIEAATREIGGTFIPSPMWATPAGNMLVTVQPLGGCDMGDHADHGVVNHRGQVFDGNNGSKVHEGLYVADGAVVPSPLGSNPSLTISALAERISDLLIEDLDAKQPKPHARPRAEPVVPGFRFSERMRGYLSMHPVDDYEEGFTQGRAEGSAIDFSVTITYADVAALLRDQSSRARMSGTVIAPALSSKELTVTGGIFKLFESQPDEVETYRMVYELDLLAAEGKYYKLRGHKVLKERGALSAWRDSTTLFVEVTDERNRVIGVGGMRIGFIDFIRLVLTMRATGEPSRRRRWRYQMEFLSVFVRKFLNLYGGPLDSAGGYRELPTDVKVPVTGARPSKFRPGSFDSWWYDSKTRNWNKTKRPIGTAPGDNAELQLFRFRGGNKGPVMLAPGFAMSATSYLADTTNTSLAEYLYSNGFDVWLFDTRTGIQLPSSGGPYSLDDIAKEDWPRAVRHVRRVTRKPSVQVFAHCTNSLTFQMAMLAGLEDVRSAICSQVTVDLSPGRWMKFKLFRPLEKAVGLLGRASLSPDERPTFGSKLKDLVFRALTTLIRTERCGQALCRWVEVVYGKTHNHAQLNDATHQALHAMFGRGAIEPGKQFAECMRQGFAVDKDKKDTYRKGVKNMAIPIMFLHGCENSFFLPEGSKRTYDWLCRENGSSLYKRKVLPGYAHLDTFLGKNSHIDVYPKILEHLEETATV
jgi:cholesterol oxidase